MDHGKILAEYRSNSTLTKKIYDRTMEPLCDHYHITRMELDILLFLTNNPGYDTATDIVEQKRFTKSHVSCSLRLLDEKGYIQLTFYPGNRKTVHLKVLPAASEIVKAGQEAQRNVFCRIFGGLSPEELDMLKQISHKINATLRDDLKEE